MYEKIQQLNTNLLNQSSYCWISLINKFVKKQNTNHLNRIRKDLYRTNDNLYKNLRLIAIE